MERKKGNRTTNKDGKQNTAMKLISKIKIIDEGIKRGNETTSERGREDGKEGEIEVKKGGRERGEASKRRRK